MWILIAILVLIAIGLILIAPSPRRFQTDRDAQTALNAIRPRDGGAWTRWILRSLNQWRLPAEADIFHGSRTF